MEESASSAFVVDASVVAKWHLQDEEHSDRATRLYLHFVEGSVELLAPASIRYEVPAAITRASRGRQPRVSQEVAIQSIEAFLGLDIELHDDVGLILAAYPLVHRFDCTLYDAFYLALSEREGAPFITADAKLYRRVRGGASVVWLGDY